MIFNRVCNRKHFLVYNVFKEVLSLHSLTIEIQHQAIRETERKDPKQLHLLLSWKLNIECIEWYVLQFLKLVRSTNNNFSSGEKNETKMREEFEESLLLKLLAHDIKP